MGRGDIHFNFTLIGKSVTNNQTPDKVVSAIIPIKENKKTKIDAVSNGGYGVVVYNVPALIMRAFCQKVHDAVAREWRTTGESMARCVVGLCSLIYRNYITISPLRYERIRACAP